MPHLVPPQKFNLERWRHESKDCQLRGIKLGYRGTSLIRKRPPPWDPPRTLVIGLW